jgi:hypothetical protein
MDLNQTVEEWMDIPYQRLICQMGEGNEKCYLSFLPQFGIHTITGCGLTPEESIESLELSMRTALKVMFQNGKKPPELIFISDADISIDYDEAVALFFIASSRDQLR